MRKLLLFFTIAFLGMSVTSCFKFDNSIQNRTDILYIKEYQGKKYAISALPGYNVITSNQIGLMSPGSFYYTTWSWEEEDGFEPIGNISAMKATLSETSKEMVKSLLVYSPAPVELPEISFTDLQIAAVDPYGLFENNWIFDYTFKNEEKKNPESRLIFFPREREDSKKVEIDIRLEITDQGEEDKEGTSNALNGNITSVDMSFLKSIYDTDYSSEHLKFIFYYYKEKHEEPQKIELNARDVFIKENEAL